MKIQHKLVSLLCIFILLLMTPMGAFAGQASDVTNHWAGGQIIRLMDSNVINGYQDGTFRPNNSITRAEFMAMVNRAFQYSEKSDASYKDVPASAWYADIIKQAMAAGYISGYADGTMKPNNYITRQEAAVIIAKIKNLAESADSAAGFKDTANIPDWSRGAIGATAEAGIMSGYPDGSFKGGNNITRAEAAVILDKVLGFAAYDSIVLKNGVIYTMDAKNTVATAIAVAGNKIVYVGNDAGAEKYIGENTKVIDLKGQMVTPGFVDGHCHPTLAPPPEEIRLEDVEPTIEAYQAAIKEYAASHPELKVIRGEGFQIKAFSDAIPKASMIDAVVSDRPVLIWDTSEHGLLLNTAALKAANITKDTKAPEGGQIYKYADGTPTGYLSDASSLTDVIPDDTPAPTEQERIDAFKGFQTEMNGYGITAVDGGGSEADVYKAMDDFSKSGEMTMRVNLPYSPAGYTAADAIEAVKALNENQKYNSDYQHVSQVKQFIDGVPEGKTVLLMEPYPPEAGMPTDYKGPQYCTQDELNQFAAIIDEAGYQVLIHAMGDGGANVCLNAYDYAREQNGKRDARHVIVHANFIDKSDITRMGQDGVYAALQPIWCYFDPIFSALEKQNLGADRFAKEYTVRDMVNAGVIISGSADWSISDNRPLFGIETGVTQCSPYPGEQGDPDYLRNVNQTVSVMDMLKFYTINGAKQMFMEDKIGSLEVGKKADMVVLEKDITKITVEDISETGIMKTIFDGKIVYSETYK